MSTSGLTGDHSPPVIATVLVDAPPAAARPGYDRGFWGMALVILTEGMIFLALLSTYFFLRSTARVWPPAGVELPDLTRAEIFSVVLIGSSIPVVWAEWASRHGRQGAVRAGLLLSWLMGAAFLVYTVLDLRALPLNWDDNAYASIFYTTVGLHALHVAAGLILSLVTQVKAWRGYFDDDHHVSLDTFALYWHFVDGVWLFVFVSLIVSVRFR